MASQPTQTIPVHIGQDGVQRGEGFLTHKTDQVRQKVSFTPNRVIPIVFLPGVMGSNLRMSQVRQNEINRRRQEEGGLFTQLKNDNISWRPDNKAGTVMSASDSAEERQLRLDPEVTVVDIYEPHLNPSPTGNPSETANERHDNIKVTAGSPLLINDPPTKPAKERQTPEQKALWRGWSEVYFGSYGQVLNLVEQRMNAAFVKGKLHADWKDIVDVDPARWQAHSALEKLSEAELRKIVTGCWYPVHAFGYNWLKSNGESAKTLAKRIEKMMADYQAKGYECEKVIIVTHSMGGLVARALIHPDYGNLKDKVLGMVHGVMPAIGAGAAYKRIRCGFDEPGWTEDHEAKIVAKIAGNFGDEVTAVLANAPGGLELLPTEAYGNGWLQIRYKGLLTKRLPERGDPYSEIYALQNKWYGLLPNEEWINPARLPEAGFKRTTRFIYNVKQFHRDIVNTYHDVSYAHYGADTTRRAFQNVVWEIADADRFEEIDKLRIVEDNRQGQLTLASLNSGSAARQVRFTCTLQPAVEAGDQTVPIGSADHQLQSGKFKGIFRQTGYEHQGSYKNEGALCATLYSIAKIAKEMPWFKS